MNTVYKKKIYLMCGIPQCLVPVKALGLRSSLTKKKVFGVLAMPFVFLN